MEGDCRAVPKQVRDESTARPTLKNRAASAAALLFRKKRRTVRGRNPDESGRSLYIVYSSLCKQQDKDKIVFGREGPKLEAPATVKRHNPEGYATLRNRPPSGGALLFRGASGTQFPWKIRESLSKGGGERIFTCVRQC